MKRPVPNGNARFGRTRARRAAGFSLIEVMIAISVLGIILVAVGGLMTGNLQLRRTSTVSTEAQQLATSYLESVKRTWSALDAYVGTPDHPSYGALPGPPSDPRLARYTLELDITCLNLAGDTVDCSTDREPELRQVRVRVADGEGAYVADLVTQVGRPFEPRSTR